MCFNWYNLCFRRVLFSTPLSSALVTVCHQGIFLSVNLVSSHFWTNSISLGLLSRPQGAFQVSSGQSEYLKCNKEQIWRHMSPETKLCFFVLKYNQFNQFHWRGEDNSSILELNTNINLITVVGQDELVGKSLFALFKKQVMIWTQTWSSESF